MLSQREIVASYDRPGLVEEERVYLYRHAPRYAYLLALVDELRAELGFAPDGEGMRVLDVGPSFQTQLLRDLYPRSVVTTLGLEPSAVSTARPGERHVSCDLNDVLDRAGLAAVDPHPLVLMAEVIEHLHAPAASVLRCASSWLQPAGVLVVQTPNAAALHKRLALLRGRNPYHELRDSRTNPGHFREYTLSELRRYAQEAGLEVASASRESYFAGTGFRPGLYRLIRPVLPPGLREGITLVLRRR